jgi:aldehyde dehydrogenase (NAD+)
MNSIEQIEELRQKQHSFFYSGITKNVNYRRDALLKFRRAILKYDREISAGLKKDLNKSSFEAYATETGIVLHELRTQINNVSAWAKPKKVSTPLFAMPSNSMIVPEPLGRVFIISPWNYPFQLL